MLEAQCIIGMAYETCGKIFLSSVIPTRIVISFSHGTVLI